MQENWFYYFVTRVQSVEFWNTKSCSGYGKGRERGVLSHFVIPTGVLVFFKKKEKKPLKSKKGRKLATEGLFDARGKKQFFYATRLNLFHLSLKRVICFPFSEPNAVVMATVYL